MLSCLKQKTKTNANKRKTKAKPQLDKSKKTKSAQVSSEKPTIVAEKQPDDAIATNFKMDDILASATATSQHINQKKLGDLTVDEIMEYLVERK